MARLLGQRSKEDHSAEMKEQAEKKRSSKEVIYCDITQKAGKKYMDSPQYAIDNVNDYDVADF